MFNESKDDILELIENWKKEMLLLCKDSKEHIKMIQSIETEILRQYKTQELGEFQENIEKMLENPDIEAVFKYDPNLVEFFKQCLFELLNAIIEFFSQTKDFFVLPKPLCLEKYSAFKTALSAAIGDKINDLTWTDNNGSIEP